MLLIQWAIKKLIYFITAIYENSSQHNLFFKLSETNGKIFISKFYLLFEHFRIVTAKMRFGNFIKLNTGQFCVSKLTVLLRNNSQYRGWKK